MSQANYQVRRANNRVLLLKVPTLTSLSGPVGLKQSRQGNRPRFYLLAAGADNVATETANKDSEAIEGSYSGDGPTATVPSVNSPAADDKIPPTDEVAVAPQVLEESNGAVGSTNPADEDLTAKSSSTSRRAPLTARERLRAARVLSRYTDPKPSKPELGSKLLEALRETDKGKRRPSLPEAPTNMLDDSKRGMPKEGWTINISSGMDAILIVFSFVFISSVMFATTYIVWKVGAIHFNDY